MLDLPGKRPGQGADGGWTRFPQVPPRRASRTPIASSTCRTGSRFLSDGQEPILWGCCRPHDVVVQLDLDQAFTSPDRRCKETVKTELPFQIGLHGQPPVPRQALGQAVEDGLHLAEDAVGVIRTLAVPPYWSVALLSSRTPEPRFRPLGRRPRYHRRTCFSTPRRWSRGAPRRPTRSNRWPRRSHGHNRATAGRGEHRSLRGWRSRRRSLGGSWSRPSGSSDFHLYLTGGW